MGISMQKRGKGFGAGSALLVSFVLAACQDCAPQRQVGEGTAECAVDSDCLDALGPAPGGCAWSCVDQLCWTDEGCETTPRNSSNTVASACSSDADCASGTLPDDCSGGSWSCLDNACRPVCGDPDNGGGCLSDRIDPPQQGDCTCACVDCACSAFDCTCPVTCYASEEGCAITIGADGAAEAAPGFLDGCDVSCTPEDDLSDEFACMASNCELPPNNIQLQPDRSTAQDNERIDRQVRDAGLLIAVDTSGSMQPKQMASACAMDAYFTAAGNAEFSIGITTMDVEPLYGDDGSLIGSPHLVSVDGSCGGALQCDCAGSHSGDVCQMSAAGTMVSSEDAGAHDTLRQLIVQGSNEASNNDEAGLEKLFLMVFDLIAQGRGEEISQVVAISDEKANSDDEMCAIQAQRYAPAKLAHLQSVLGADFSPPPNSGDCDTDLSNFYTYFFSRYGIQVNVLVDTDTGSADYGAIYIAVAQATGGAVGDIYDCTGFVTFFEAVGFDTSIVSTELCLGHPVDPDSITVTHVESGATVPRDPVDGWVYDDTFDCLVLNGAWEETFGQFDISYAGGEQVSSQLCFPPGVDPIESTLVVTHPTRGFVPPSAVDGWTFDPATDCLSLNGSWAGDPGPYDIEYL